MTMPTIAALDLATDTRLRATGLQVFAYQLPDEASTPDGPYLVYMPDPGIVGPSAILAQGATRADWSCRVMIVTWTIEALRATRESLRGALTGWTPTGDTQRVQPFREAPGPTLIDGPRGDRRLSQTIEFRTTATITQEG